MPTAAQLLSLRSLHPHPVIALLITGGGDLKVLSQKLEWKASPRVGSLDNVKHKAGGGQVQIFDEKYARSSRSSSQARAQTPASASAGQQQAASEKEQPVSPPDDSSRAASSSVTKPALPPKPAARKASNGAAATRNGQT